MVPVAKPTSEHSLFAPAEDRLVGGREDLDHIGADRAVDDLVRAQLLNVIAAEGPVERRRLARTVAHRFDLHRLNEKRIPRARASGLLAAILLLASPALAPALRAGSPMDDLRALTTKARCGQTVLLKSSRAPAEMRPYQAYLVRLSLAQQFGQEHSVSVTVVARWVRQGQLVPIQLRERGGGLWAYRVPRLQPGRYAYAIWCRSCGGHMAMSWPNLGTRRTATASRLLRVLH